MYVCAQTHTNTKKNRKRHDEYTHTQIRWRKRTHQSFGSESGLKKIIDPDPVCLERLDPDPVNIRTDPKPRGTQYSEAIVDTISIKTGDT